MARWHGKCTFARIVKARELMTALGILAVLAIPALADLPCQPPSVPPVLTVSAFLDQLVGSLLQHGVSILFAGALLVVGLPWMMAGLAIALFQLARRKA